MVGPMGHTATFTYLGLQNCHHFQFPSEGHFHKEAPAPVWVGKHRDGLRRTRRSTGDSNTKTLRFGPTEQKVNSSTDEQLSKKEPLLDTKRGRGLQPSPWHAECHSCSCTRQQDALPNHSSAFTHSVRWSRAEALRAIFKLGSEWDSSTFYSFCSAEMATTSQTLLSFTFLQHQ